MLDELTHLPEVGDVLILGELTLPIADVSRHMFRSCLMGWPLVELGSIGVATNVSAATIKRQINAHTRKLVTWIPKHDLP